MVHDRAERWQAIADWIAWLARASASKEAMGSEAGAADTQRYLLAMTTTFSFMF
jgi:hypothetical protein